MAATSKNQRKGFDLKAVGEMNPPIRIRIERRNTKNGTMEPIPLPQDVWSLEDAQQIEQVVLNDVAGGGYYKGQMTDSGGRTMEWEFAFEPSLFPPLIPQGSAGALGAGPQPAAPAAAASGGAPFGWRPGMFGSPVAPPAPPHVPSYSGGGGGGGWGGNGWSGNGGAPYSPPNPWSSVPPWAYVPPPPVTSSSRRDDPERDQLRMQLDQVRQQAAEERHAREREASEARHREELRAQQAAFAEEMRQMREAIAQQQRQQPTGETPEMAALKAQLADVRRANEEAQRRTEQLQAEQRHREELRALQDQTAAQINALKELVAKASENRGPDPQMTLLIEMQRQQMESSREQARSQAETTRETARMAAEQPRVMVEMMEKLRSASGSEQHMANMSAAWMGLMEQQRSVLEMVMNMGPDPKMALAEGALAGGKEILERFMTGKRDADIAAQRTEQVRAQAQAQQAAYVAQAQAAAAQAQAAAAQAPYRHEDGSIKGQPPTREQLGGAPAGAPAAAPAGAGPAVPTEDALFGPLKEHVDNLREHMKAGRAQPAHVAQAITQAALLIDQEELTVPAFRLFVEQRYAELIEILLPTASTEFVNQTIVELQQRLVEIGLDEMVEPKVGDQAIGDEDGGDEEGGDDDEEDDAS